MDVLALVEPTRVVVGHGSLDRLRELEPSFSNEVGDELDDLHDLDIEVGAEVRRIVLGEVDVVMRLDGDDTLHARGTPVGEVVFGERTRLLDVPHLGSGTTATPLLVHQAELDAGLLQHLGGRACVGRAVERRLAVGEQDRLAADGNVEAGGPVPYVVLALRCVAGQYRARARCRARGCASSRSSSPRGPDPCRRAALEQPVRPSPSLSALGRSRPRTACSGSGSRNPPHCVQCT